MAAPVKCSHCGEEAIVRVEPYRGGKGALCARCFVNQPEHLVTKVLNKDALEAINRQRDADANARKALR